MFQVLDCFIKLEREIDDAGTFNLYSCNDIDESVLRIFPPFSLFLATPMFFGELELEVMQFGQLGGWLGTLIFLHSRQKLQTNKLQKANFLSIK